MGALRSSYSWQAADEALLRDLHKQGLSASQIAKRISGSIGITISRNSVIGKIHRLGLQGHKPIKRTQPRRPAPKRVRKDLEAAPSTVYTPPPMLETLKLPPAQARGAAAAIDALVPGTCRWPVGDPQDLEFRFCGHEAPVGASYCKHHGQLSRHRRQLND
jgi:GcrA cell cycle regulator